LILRAGAIVGAVETDVEVARVAEPFE